MIRNSFSILPITLIVNLLLFVACGDDDGYYLRPDLPASSADNVKSIKHLGGVVSTYDWEFIYSDGFLIGATGIVRDSSSTIDKTFSYTSWLDFGKNSVSISTTSDEKISVCLNAHGLIEKMSVNRNIYEFYYDNNRLVKWNKTIFEESFGQATKYSSSAELEYDGEDIRKIVMREADNIPVVYTFIMSDYPNLNGLLPVGLSKEFGCLGFEHLYYAGLMGQPSAHLIKSVEVTYINDSSKNYITEYDYNIKNGNTVLCNYKTPNGEIASVSYTY